MTDNPSSLGNYVTADIEKHQHTSVGTALVWIDVGNVAMREADGIRNGVCQRVQRADVGISDSRNAVGDHSRG